MAQGVRSNHAPLRRITPKWAQLIAALLFAFWILDFGFWISRTSGAEKAQAQYWSYYNLKSKIQNPKSDEGRYYEATGYTLAPQFIDFYDNHGGVPLFGYPVSEARMEGGYLVQWTERQRLEWHPEHKGSQYEVLLGLLGRELTRGFAGPAFNGQPPDFKEQSASTEAYFSETQQSVAEPFLTYWNTNGDMPVFGFPISSLHTNDAGLRVQWFERARFEYHPELPEQYRVLLGHLGLEALGSRDIPYYEMAVHPNPAPESKLRIGLAQGGESDDPAFFDNVRDPGSQLGPGMVRLDNIFNFYDVVRRAPDGTITYHWAKLDQVVDGVRAMGKEPFICLSYMPETMSATSRSRVEPPASYAEWSSLVRATVYHLNVERKLGIKYWEVWNEPNEWAFWQASYPEYLRLYDATVQAALSADPTIRIGGPSASRFAPNHIAELLEHQAAVGAAGRIDFISWHSYGDTPAQMAANIREARKILERFPQFNPELIVSEFNVLQGGAGDTSANGYTDRVEAAIALMSSLESMQRERLDHALLFELKDGKGPRQFWGRWGILSYDGHPKPIYHALRAYQARPGAPLPITLKGAPADGRVGLMAFGGPHDASLILWHTGPTKARVKIALPHSFGGLDFTLTLFDATHNNPARSGDATLRPWLERNAGDLVVELQPSSLVLLDSR